MSCFLLWTRCPVLWSVGGQFLSRLVDATSRCVVLLSIEKILSNFSFNRNFGAFTNYKCRYCWHAIMFNTNAQNWYGMTQSAAAPAPTGSSIAHLINSTNNNGSGSSHPFVRQRSMTCSNPTLERNALALRPQSPPNVQVEYEVAVPFVSGYRHTPYHSLWDLHQW